MRLSLACTAALIAAFTARPATAVPFDIRIADEAEESGEARSPKSVDNAVEGAAIETPPVDVNERYPFRIPDWLWQDERRLTQISPAERKSLEYDIQIVKALQQLDDSTASDVKDNEIAGKLCRYFSISDLCAGGTTFRNETTGVALCVQIDPEFNAAQKKTLLSGVELLLACALDDGVIANAIKKSIVEPSPMPPKFDEQDSAQLSDAYKFYLTHRPKPESVDQFKSHLRLAFSSPTGDPGLICISKYHGNVWWGGAYYDFFHVPEMQLSRFAPEHGFLFVRLNSDKMQPSEPSWDEPAFWAAKMSHELLHNLGYWHPSYADPDERDRNNQGDKKAFMVAYEQEIYSKAKPLEKKLSP
jgi:hypothetical protein